MWQITSINNASHQVTIKNGRHQISFTVPEEHRHREHKKLYIQSVMDAYDKVQKFKLKLICYSSVFLMISMIVAAYVRFHV